MNEIFLMSIAFFPLFLMFSIHPFDLIRSFSRTLAIISMVLIIGFLPIAFLIHLEKWGVLIFVIPIVFRLLEMFFKKLDMFPLSNLFTNEIVFDLLIGSLGFLTIIYLSSELNLINFGFWFALLVFSSAMRNFRNFLKEDIVYDVICGIIALGISLYTNKLYGILFFMFAYLIVYIFYYILHKIFSNLEQNEYIHTIIIVLIPIIFLLMLNYGNPSILWSKFIWISLIFVIVNLLTISVSVGIENTKLPNVIKQFSTPFLILGIILIMLFMINSQQTFKEFLMPSVIFLSIAFTIVILGRIYSVINYLFNPPSKFIQLEKLREGFKLFFSEKLGSALFKIIFGSFYSEVKLFTSVGLILVFLGIEVLVLWVTKQNMLLSISYYNLFTMYYFKIPFSLLAPLFGINLFNKILEILNCSNYEFKKGYDEEEARNKSIGISISYLFFLLTIISTNLSFINEINSKLLVFLGIWLVMMFYSISICLGIDLTKGHFNELKNTRNAISVFLYDISFLSSLLFLISFYNFYSISFDVTYFMIFIIIIPFIGTLMSKLIGYDIEIASKEMHEKSLTRIREAILIILFLVVTAPFNFIFQLSAIIFILSLAQLLRRIAIVIIPYTNKKEWRVADFVLFKRLRKRLNRSK